MKKVFLSGEFSAFKKQNLNESRQAVYESYTQYNKREVTIFISHKHEDLGGYIGCGYIHLVE